MAIKSYTTYSSMYNNFANDYQYMSNRWNNYNNKWFKPTYKFTPAKADKEVSKILEEYYRRKFEPKLDIPENRSLLDRAFDMLLTPLYVSAGAVKGLVDGSGKGTITPWEGIKSGLRAGNPLGKGYEPGEHTYSQVLEAMGWKPESTIGKIAKGSVGFVLDVFLDPTTYLSGGGTALVKGTGKANKVVKDATKEAKDFAKKYGVKDVSDIFKLPEKVYDTIKNDYTKKGINPDLAERFAKRQSDELFKIVERTQPMTLERAKDIIKSSGLKYKSHELAKDAEKLMNEYNRVVGFAKEVKPITFSLRNAPFGDKIFGRLAQKEWVLSSGNTLRKIGDYTFSPVYNRLRDSIYGGVLGKLFSPTNSPLYRASLENPAKVYEFLKYVERVRGIGEDILKSENKIRQKANMLLNLPPAEQKKVLEELQDARNWHMVKKTIKALDTREAQIFKKRTEMRRNEIREKIKELESSMKNIDALKKKASEDTSIIRDAVKALEKELEETLADLDLKYVTERDELRQVIEALGKQQEKLSKTVKKPQTKEELELRMRTELSNWYKEYENAKKSLDSHMKTKHVTDTGAVKLEKNTKEANYAEAMAKKLSTAPNQDAKYEFLRWLGRYLYNDDSFFSPKTSDVIVEGVGKLLKQGKGRSAIEAFVDDNMHIISELEHAKNSLIANMLGYDNWIKAYVEPMEEIVKARKKQGGLTLRQERDLAQLRQLKLRRDLLRRQLEGKALPDVMQLRKEFENKRMYEGLEEIESSFYSTARHMDDTLESRRNKFTDEDRALVDDALGKSYKTGEFDDVYAYNPKIKFHKEFKTAIDAYVERYKNIYGENVVHSKGFRERMRLAFQHIDSVLVKDFHKEIDQLKPQELDRLIQKISSKAFMEQGMIPIERSIIKSDLAEFIQEKSPTLKSGKAKDYKRLVEAQMRFIDEVVDEIEPLLKDFFKREYVWLTDKQRKLLFNMSITNARKRVDGAKIATKNKKVLKQIADAYETKAKRFLERERLRVLKLELRPQSQVAFRSDGEVWKGTVEKMTRLEGDTYVYTIRRNDGKVIEDVPLADIHTLFTDKGALKGEDLLKLSPATKEFVQQQQEIVEKLSGAKERLTSLTKEVSTKKQEIIQDFMERKRNLTKTLEDYNKKLSEYERELASGKQVDKLRRELDEIENALVNDDAFETFMRMKVGDENVDRWVKFADSPAITYLQSRTDLSDTMKAIIDDLRESFMEMGRYEVAIGKLDKEAFEYWISDYVPRILTPDGVKYFASNKIREHGASLTQDLGYGRKFNPHQIERKIKKIKLNGKWIERPTIAQLNEYFEPLLKGRNAFVDKLSDLYLARALKHNELMYDYRYMHEMMYEFGYAIPKDGKIKKGYKAVANYGVLRKNIYDVAKIRVTKELMHMAKDELRSAYKALREEAVKHVKEQMSKEAKDYIKVQRLLGVQGKVELPKVSPTEFNIRVESAIASMIEKGQANKPGLKRLSKEDYFALFNQKLDETLADFGIPRSLLDKEATPMVELSKEQIEKISRLFPNTVRQVSELIVNKANQARKLQMAKDQSRFLQIYDKFLHWVKLNQTTVSPAFHIRNKLSNMYLNWLAIGRDALNPQMQMDAFRVVHSRGKKGVAKYPIVYPTKEGYKVMHWDELYSIAKQYGVIDEGFFAKDIGAGAMVTGKIKGLPAHLDPTDTGNFVLYKWGMEIGSYVENTDRLIHFASMIKRGKSFEESARSAKNFLFDYSELTAFEQSVMKRIMPYYTWLRKNARLQVSQLIHNPERLQRVAHAMTGLEGMTNQEDRMNPAFVSKFATDWIQTPFFAGNEPILWNPNLPFMDLSRIPDPFDIEESVREWLSQTAPMIKIPLELGLNKNFFFDSEIVGEDDNPVTTIGDYLGKQTQLYTLAEGMVNKEGLDKVLHTANYFTGQKFLSYDYNAFKAQRLEELRSGEGQPINLVEGVGDIFGELGEGISDAIRRYLDRLGR